MQTASNPLPDDLSALNERLENIETTLRLILIHLVMDEANRSVSIGKALDGSLDKGAKTSVTAAEKKKTSKTKAKASAAVKSRRKTPWRIGGML